MLQFLGALGFLLSIVLIGAALLWILGFSMWAFHLTPDDNPFILFVGAIAALFLTYYASKHLHAFIQRRL